MSRKKEILHQISSYAFASQITQAISMMVGILTRNFLGPFQMGIWATLQIVLHYASYTALGTTVAISREIPYFIGRRDEESAECTKNVVSTFQILTSFLTAAGVVIYAFVFRGKHLEFLFWGLLSTAAMIVLQRINNLLVGLLRAYKKFGLASRQMVVSALANAVLVISLTYFYKLYGFLAAMILSFVFNIFYILRHERISFRYQLDARIKQCISFGVPLLVLGIMGAFLKSIDKIVIVKMLGFEAAGYYSIALMAMNFMENIPNTVGIIIIPHFEEKFGAVDKAEDLKGFVEKTASGLAHIMPITIGLAWIIAPLFTSLFLPKYIPGIRAAQWLIFGTFFSALSLPYANLVITLNKHLLLFPVSCAAFGFAIASNVLAVRWGWGITGVAFATALTQVLYFTALFLLSARFLYASTPGQKWKIFGIFFGEAFFLLAFLFGLENILYPQSRWVSTLIQMGVFGVLCVPLIFSLERNFGVLSHVKERWKSR